MKGHDFKRWRKELDWSQKQAADHLGLKRRVVQYYEKGERDGETVKIPRAVRLACYALTLGVSDYHGPEKVKNKDRDRDKDRDKGRAKDRDRAVRVKAGKAPKEREKIAAVEAHNKDVKKEKKKRKKDKHRGDVDPHGDDA